MVISVGKRMILPLIIFVTDSGGFLFPKEKCYEHIGCFSRESPYNNTRIFLPDSPSKIGIKFYLNTQNNPTESQLLNPFDVKTITSSNINNKKKTFIIIHGYTSNANKFSQFKNELYKKGNVIRVDWSKGAETHYFQAAANTRVVGAVLAKLIQKLKTESGVLYSDIHIIGHSLGAHTAGYAGERVTKVGRITGLDPAGPLFQNFDIKVRLDPSDAKFVDIIHTDDSPLSEGEITDQVACSHGRAVKYFMESINSACAFTAYPCDTYKHFKDGNCVTGGTPMGFKANSMARGNFYLLTNDASPFCIK